jgi:hypothetical protein
VSAPFLTLALSGSEEPASYPCHFSVRDPTFDTHYIESWLGFRASVDFMQKRKIFPLLGIESQLVGCSVSSLVAIVTDVLWLSADYVVIKSYIL